MSFIPKRPTGNDEEALYHKALWDKAYGSGRLIDTPQIRYEKTTRGIVARIRHRKAAATGVAGLDPFEIYTVPSEEGDPANSVRYRVAPGYYEWRLRFPDGFLAGMFEDLVEAEGDPALGIEYCHRTYEFLGTNSATDLVIQNTSLTAYNVVLSISETEANIAANDKPTETISTIPIPPTGRPGFRTYFTLGVPSWTQTVVIGLIGGQISGSLISPRQIIRDNLYGQWNNMDCLRRIDGNMISEMMYYPGDLVEHTGARLRMRYKDLATLDIDPNNDSYWITIYDPTP